VFVSALVVRGRNDTRSSPTALIDLGRPSFKLGIAGIEVGQRAHRLEVEVKTDRASYQIREKARARIKVRTPEGAPPPAGTEVTLAAVDEGLLELAPNDSWNLLEAMMANAATHGNLHRQLQVTGKRHFGKKALPAGGGGGKLPTRELFDTLLFWQAEVALDAQGEASVEIPLNDSLTAFRIVAIAASENRFGTGKTAHPQQPGSAADLRSVAGGTRRRPPASLLHVRNGSSRDMKIEVEATPGPQALPTRQLTLKPGEARKLSGRSSVPETRPRDGVLEWTLEAKEIATQAPAKAARDALKVGANHPCRGAGARAAPACTGWNAARPAGRAAARQSAQRRTARHTHRQPGRWPDRSARLHAALPVCLPGTEGVQGRRHAEILPAGMPSSTSCRPILPTTAWPTSSPASGRAASRSPPICWRLPISPAGICRRCENPDAAGLHRLSDGRLESPPSTPGKTRWCCVWPRWKRWRGGRPRRK
jgi:hypothetical protein